MKGPSGFLLAHELDILSEPGTGCVHATDRNWHEPIGKNFASVVVMLRKVQALVLRALRGLFTSVQIAIILHAAWKGCAQVTHALSWLFMVKSAA